MTYPLGDHPSDHIAVWQAETYESDSDRSWYAFIDQVEKLMGRDPDGDNSDAAKAAGTADGYSLDEFHDLWEDGLTARQAIDRLGVQL